MCNLSEGIYERGMAQGITQEKENVIKSLWEKGMDVDFIKDVTKWTEEQILRVVGKTKS